MGWCGVSRGQLTVAPSLCSLSLLADAGCGAQRTEPEQSCRTDHLGAQPGVASAGQGTKRAIPGQATHSDPWRSCHGEGGPRSLAPAVSGSSLSSGILRLPPPCGMHKNHKREVPVTSKHLSRAVDPSEATTCTVPLPESSTRPLCSSPSFSLHVFSPQGLSL